MPWPVVLSVLLMTGCGESRHALPGEGTTGTPCGRIIENCSARRLPNVVLRDGETDGAFFSVDGLDTTGILSFDEALVAGWKTGWIGGGKTVQVLLGASDVWEPGAHLYYAVEWGGTCGFPDAGPGTYETGPCDIAVSTVVDAGSGEHVVTGSEG